jgi:tetratricopeptide (TPR) repeat protein
MLTLLHTPQWQAAGGHPQRVPATLPGAMLLHLAAQDSGRGGWVERERLAALFWPDRASPQVQRNLRVNLHRLRELLAGWDIGARLEAERTRLRLALPTDLSALAATLTQGGVTDLLHRSPHSWMTGFRLPGFDAFAEWSDEQAQYWLRAWADAVELALLRSLQQADPRPEDEAARLPLLSAWCEAGGTAMPALRALNPSSLTPAARGAWQQLCARLPDGAGVAVAAAAGAVADTMPEAAAGETTPMTELPGRTSHQQTLRGSRAPVVVVLGEPGVGKSSLLLSCSLSAPVLRGREGLTGAPFTPVLEWLRLNSRRWRPALLQASGGASLAAYRLDLARLLPELAPDEPLPPLDAHTAKARLLEALCRLFEREGPLLLVDDLQWCDRATLEWLVFVAHRGRQRWHASARVEELAGPSREVLDALLAARLAQEVPLQGLSREDLSLACRQRWPDRFNHDTPAAVLDQLHRASAGNPFVLGELVALGADERLAQGLPVSLPPRARDLVSRRLQALGETARALVEASSILVQPAPLSLLLALCENVNESAAWTSCAQAIAADLLAETEGGLQCRHDLIRSAAEDSLGQTRRQWLHRRAALALAHLPAPEPLVIARHWQAAGEPQTALSWLYQGAAQQKDRGRFDEARALWQSVAGDSVDATLALRARLSLAECELFSNLATGRLALEEVLQQVAAVADPQQRHPIEAQALAGLVDNAVFSGDVPRAQRLAPRLRELLPSLRTEERVHAVQVLMELAMREPDIPQARALLQQMQRLVPRNPATLSFEAQMEWFAGDVRAARAAFETLLERHPDYCSGLTIENDLAVMLYTLGELAGAQQMAQRSLCSWRGVPHTEALSLLVLGSILTSQGLYADAHATLERALLLAREQGSGLFESEALARRARLWLLCGHWDAATCDLDAADVLLRNSQDPLRVSQYALLRVACQMACAQPCDAALAERLRGLSRRSVHPVLHARLARLESLLALQGNDAEAAVLAARRAAEIARGAGLQELLCEALLLQARALSATGPSAASVSLWQEAAALADAKGFADCAWRAHAQLARRLPSAATRAAERRARRRLQGEVRPALFRPEHATRLEPCGL